MNPLGLILVGLGLILIIIGFKGSQHSVINALKGVKGAPPTGTLPKLPGKGQSPPGLAPGGNDGGTPPVIIA